jgi:hypothetical protein
VNWLIVLMKKGRFSTTSEKKMKRRWYSLYDLQLKRQSATWKSPSLPRKKQSWQDTSKGKVILELFSNSSGTVHMEFIPEGVTVNKHCYKEIIRHLDIQFIVKCPEILYRNNWLLLHKDAPCISLCAYPKVTGKTTGHHFATPSILTCFRTMWFHFLSLLERKAT